MQRFLFTGWAMVYSKLVAIELVLGTMERVPAASGRRCGLHLCATHLGLWTRSLSWSGCAVYSAGWGPRQEVDWPVDLVHPGWRLGA